MLQMLCFVILAYYSEEKPWIRKGVRDLKSFTEKITKHEKSKKHINSTVYINHFNFFLILRSKYGWKRKYCQRNRPWILVVFHKTEQTNEEEQMHCLKSLIVWNSAEGLNCLWEVTTKCRIRKPEGYFGASQFFLLIGLKLGCAFEISYCIKRHFKNNSKWIAG